MQEVSAMLTEEECERLRRARTYNRALAASDFAAVSALLLAAETDDPQFALFELVNRQWEGVYVAVVRNGGDDAPAATTVTAYQRAEEALRLVESGGAHVEVLPVLPRLPSLPTLQALAALSAQQAATPHLPHARPAGQEA